MAYIVYSYLARGIIRHEYTRHAITMSIKVGFTERFKAHHACAATAEGYASRHNHVIRYTPLPSKLSVDVTKSLAT